MEDVQIMGGLSRELVKVLENGRIKTSKRFREELGLMERDTRWFDCVELSW